MSNKKFHIWKYFEDYEECEICGIRRKQGFSTIKSSLILKGPRTTKYLINGEWVMPKDLENGEELKFCKSKS